MAAMFKAAANLQKKKQLNSSAKFMLMMHDSLTKSLLFVNFKEKCQKKYSFV